MDVGACEQLTDRIARILLPLPIPELRAVNCYVVLGDSSVTLIDPGWSSEESDRALRAGLMQLGRSVDDVAQILVTHHHWDHYTQAVALRREFGTPISLGREECHSIAAWKTLRGAFPQQVGLLARAGADELSSAVGAMDFTPEEKSTDFSFPDTWLDDGDVVDCDGIKLVAVATPGHTRGHVVFEEPTEHLYMTGDHVLPHITPSIAYEREPSDQSLVSYMSSLRLLLERPDGQMLPAHREPEWSTQARVEELLAHHEARLDEVANLVADGARTAFTVAERMRWTKRGRSLKELGDVHAMTAVLEVAAHLTWLELDGALELDSVGGVDRYATK